MSRSSLAEAEELLGQLAAPMFEARTEGVAFWGFYLDAQATDAEPDIVLGRLSAGRGVFAVEFVWDAALKLTQRGLCRVVHTLDELRAMHRRADEIRAGMEDTRRRLHSRTTR